MTVREPRQCTAKSKRTGVRCLRPPLVGLQKCYHHAGVRYADHRARVELDTRARKLLAGMDRPGTLRDPLTELLSLAAEVKAWKDALAQLVLELDALRYQAGQGEQIRAEVQLFTAAQRDLGKLLVDIGRLDIDQRLARIEEDKARRLREVLTIACRRLGIDLTEPRVIEAVQAGIAATEPAALAAPVRRSEP